MLQECCCCPVLGESCWCCRVLQVAVWRGGVLQVLLSKCRSCLAWRCAAGAAVQVQELSGVEEGAAGAAVQVQELSGVEECFQLGENRAAHALGRQGMGQKIKRDGSGFSGCSDD
jgi:hypothetical protein